MSVYHYGGKENKDIQIKESEILRNNIDQKNNNAMSFEKFLTNMQSMITGFEENYELLIKEKKIRLLLRKYQGPKLTQVKNALHV